MNEVIQVAIIKLDKVRGNAFRRQIISSHKKRGQGENYRKYKFMTIKDAVVKDFSSGVFFECNGELDCLIRFAREISYSRVNHPEEMTSISSTFIVISVDKEKRVEH